MTMAKYLVGACGVVSVFGLLGVLLFGDLFESEAQRQTNRIQAVKLAQKLIREAQSPVTGELGGRLYRLQAERSVAAQYAQPSRSSGGYGGSLGGIFGRLQQHADDAGAMAMAMSAQQDLRRIDKEIEEIAKIYASQSAHQLEAARSKLTNADRRHMKRYHPEFLDPNVTIADLRTLQHAILSNTPATQPSRIKD